jgi:hypothetical protein
MNIKTARECGAEDARLGLRCKPRYEEDSVSYCFLSDDQVRQYLIAYDFEELDAAGLVDWYKYD